MAERIWRCQNDRSAARSAHSPLRYRRDRQRKLAVQEPSLRSASRSLATALWGALARGLLRRGQGWAPMRGQTWKPFDTRIGHFACSFLFDVDWWHRPLSDQRIRLASWGAVAAAGAP